MTDTAVPPTLTFTDTAVPPTATNTSVPPTATNTVRPAYLDVYGNPYCADSDPNACAANIHANGCSTYGHEHAGAPTATATVTPVPPTATHTSVPPTSTPTNTPVPPTATPTTVISSTSFKVELLSAVTSGTTNSPHPQIQVVNTGSGPLNLNNVTVKYWFNCDCTTQTIQAWVDWAGLIPAGSSETGNVHVSVQPTSLGGQTDYVLYSFTGNLVLQPGQAIEIQSRFNKSDWSNMTQGNDWSFAPNTSYVNASQMTGYMGGSAGLGTRAGGEARGPVGRQRGGFP